jgi:hypothetical protein
VLGYASLVAANSVTRLRERAGAGSLPLHCLAMTPLVFALLVFAISILAGAIGSLLGLGGGIILIPALTLLFHIDIRYAIGASIVAVIATSSGAAAMFVRGGLANLRVAMVLELATTSGALTGAYLAGLLNHRWLYIIFGVRDVSQAQQRRTRTTGKARTLGRLFAPS